MALWAWSFRCHLRYALTGQPDSARYVTWRNADLASVADGSSAAGVGRVHVVNGVAVFADRRIEFSEGVLELIKFAAHTDMLAHLRC